MFDETEGRWATGSAGASQRPRGGTGLTARVTCHDDPMGVTGAARPTKADVARLANVSPATVTYVLNNVEGQTISAQTKAAVHAAAKELGYRPNLAARNLAVGGSGVVLYIVPRIALGELLLDVGSRLTTALARHGVVLSLQFETDDGRNVVDAVTDLNSIAVTSVFPLSGAALEAVTTAGIPQIHLGSAQLLAMGALHLTIGEMRVDHLVSRGHRRLAFAFSDFEMLRPLGEYWLEGLRVAVAKRGLADIAVGSVAMDGTDAAPHVARYVTRDVEYYGRTVPEGSVMMMLIGAANRDHRQFPPDGDQFDLNREVHAHLGFSVGVHYCLGSALARLEGRVALEEILKRFPEWEVDLPNAALSPTSTIRGWDTMPALIR
jgi:hypothetical protein